MIDLTTIIGNVTPAIVVAVVIGLIRNILGWLENSFKDGEITPYEWTMLGSTVMKYFTYVLILSVGLPIDQAIIGAFGLDVVKSSLDKQKTVIAS